MAPPTIDPTLQGDRPSASEHGDVDLMELLQTLSNDQILRLIPKSAVQNLHYISHLIRTGDFDPNSLTSSSPIDTISRSASPTESQFSGSSSPTLVPSTPRSAYVESVTSRSPSTPNESSEEEKVKRPLNGFIAFRTYYQKMFSHLPQKNISTIITQLWKSDPFQSRWMLIGRLYSFIRDTIGKSQTKLSDFLQIAAPVMCTPTPEEYLRKLCWVMSCSDGSDVSFFQDRVGLREYLRSTKTQFSPTSEQELLNHCIVRGYLPEFSDALLAKLAQNNNTVIPSRDRSSKKRPYEEMVYQQSFTVTHEASPVSDTKPEFRMNTWCLENETYLTPTTSDVFQTPPPSMLSYSDPVWFSMPVQQPISLNFKPSLLEEQGQAFGIFNMPPDQLYDIADPFQESTIAF
uniref:Putative mating type 1-1-1 protein n=1 Tax=Thielaviopsis punctulata TaxID=72032 RepID=A0A288R678_9PEZI|nr:putative mating type 1-1-1 protein [Thielaviopsis punctulata]